MNKPCGFRVTVNGKVVTNAGIDKEKYVLSGITSLVHRKDGSESYEFYLGGVDIDDNAYLNWNNVDLKLGDIITMEVINAPFDAPINKHKDDISPEDIIKRKLKQYHYLKEKLKELI